MKVFPRFQIDNNPSSVQIMSWHQPGYKPLSELMFNWHIYASFSLNELTMTASIIGLNGNKGNKLRVHLNQNRAGPPTGAGAFSVQVEC